MPRKAPKEVIEHRITLGDYERKMISNQLAEDDTIKKVKAGAEIGKTVLIGGAVVGVGILATTAYREAQGLVDVVTDTPASLWKMTQYRLGLISLEDLIGDLSEDNQERQEAKEARKNQGILEWGFDWIMKFLLGEDMIWTKATDTTPNETNLSPFQQYKQDFDDPRTTNDIYDINEEKYRLWWIHHHRGDSSGYTYEKAYNLFYALSP